MKEKIYHKKSIFGQIKEKIQGVSKVKETFSILDVFSNGMKNALIIVFDLFCEKHT